MNCTFKNLLTIDLPNLQRITVGSHAFEGDDCNGDYSNHAIVSPMEGEQSRIQLQNYFIMRSRFFRKLKPICTIHKAM